MGTHKDSFVSTSLQAFHKQSPDTSNKFLNQRHASTVEKCYNFDQLNSQSHLCLEIFMFMIYKRIWNKRALTLRNLECNWMNTILRMYP